MYEKNLRQNSSEKQSATIIYLIYEIHSPEFIGPVKQILLA